MVSVTSMWKNREIAQKPESLGRELFSMTMQKGAEYIKQTFEMSQTPEEIKEGIIQVVARAYQKEVGYKPGAAEFLKALQKAGRIDSLAFDTWGVDYGLLDEEGRLITLEYKDWKSC